MSSVTVTLDLPDWFFERLGNPDEARRWLGLNDTPGAMDAFLQAQGITVGGTGRRRWRMT